MFEYHYSSTKTKRFIVVVLLQRTPRVDPRRRLGLDQRLGRGSGHAERGADRPSRVLGKLVLGKPGEDG